MRNIAFRHQLMAAPLKLDYTGDAGWERIILPPSTDGGPIEAAETARNGCIEKYCLPPSTDGGPIEAPRANAGTIA